MSEIVFIEYPRCTTCKKAKTWLDEHHVTYTDRNIKDDNPPKAELDAWIPASGLPLRRFFNTSGTLYRSLGVKKMLDEGMGDDAALELLASNGMLVKRPLLVVDGVPAAPGFKEAAWKEALGL